jgi:hypothetical protein
MKKHGKRLSCLICFVDLAFVKSCISKHCFVSQGLTCVFAKVRESQVWFISRRWFGAYYLGALSFQVM